MVIDLLPTTTTTNRDAADIIKQGKFCSRLSSFGSLSPQRISPCWNSLSSPRAVSPLPPLFLTRDWIFGRLLTRSRACTSVKTPPPSGAGFFSKIMSKQKRHRQFGATNVHCSVLFAFWLIDHVKKLTIFNHESKFDNVVPYSSCFSCSLFLLFISVLLVIQSRPPWWWYLTNLYYSPLFSISIQSLCIRRCRLLVNVSFGVFPRLFLVNSPLQMVLVFRLSVNSVPLQMMLVFRSSVNSPLRLMLVFLLRCRR